MQQDLTVNLEQSVEKCSCSSMCLHQLTSDEISTFLSLVVITKIYIYMQGARPIRRLDISGFKTLFIHPP